MDGCHKWFPNTLSLRFDDDPTTDGGWEKEFHLLLHGYIREQQKHLKMHIPSDIINTLQIFTNYLCLMLTRLPMHLRRKHGFMNWEERKIVVETYEIDTTETELMNACYHGFYDIVNELLNSIIPINIHVHEQDRKGNTALLYASMAGRTRIVTLLLNVNADINHQNLKGKTALWLACKKNHPNVVKLLLRSLINRVDPNLTDNDGRTALYMACNVGAIKCVKYLLNDGLTNVNQCDKKGISPLFIAAMNGDADIVKLLLQNNADANKAVEPTGWNPLLLASYSGHLKVVKVLLRHDYINIHVKNSASRNAFIEAARAGHGDIVELIYEHMLNVSDKQKLMAFVNCRDNDGLSAYNFACKANHVWIINYLLDIQHSHISQKECVSLPLHDYDEKQREKSQTSTSMDMMASPTHSSCGGLEGKENETVNDDDIDTMEIVYDKHVDDRSDNTDDASDSVQLEMQTNGTDEEISEMQQIIGDDTVLFDEAALFGFICFIENAFKFYKYVHQK